MVQLIIEIVLGAVAGFIAGRIMKTGDKDFFTNAVLGIVGGFLGGRIGAVFHIYGGWVTGLFLSVAGACLVIAIYRKVKQ